MEPKIVELNDPAALLADSALTQCIDTLGRRSAVAQHLARAITSAELFAKSATSQQQRLLLALVDNQIVGFLKAGVKHLFYVDPKGVYTEIDPLCVLDFYVLESFQRLGIGAQLFANLLQTHDVTAAQLAYDRPSPKLLAFLQKHTQLRAFNPQPNNFVVFDDYFASQR